MGALGAAWLTIQHDAWLLLVPGVVLAVVGSLVASYVSMLLEDFVVPIMYRDGVTTNEAWRRFLAVHAGGWIWFVGFALWKLILWIGAAIAIFVLAFATCCIGWTLLALPYVSTVVLLPLYVFFRLLGPEFLAQFGDGQAVLLPEAPPGLPPLDAPELEAT